MDETHATPLREVAFNDIALEAGRPDQALPLSLRQRVLGALA